MVEHIQVEITRNAIQKWQLKNTSNYWRRRNEENLTTRFCRRNS